MVNIASFFLMLLLTVSIAACSGIPGKKMYGDVKGFMVDVVTFDDEENVEDKPDETSIEEPDETTEVVKDDVDAEKAEPVIDDVKEPVELQKEDSQAVVKEDEHKHSEAGSSKDDKADEKAFDIRFGKPTDKEPSETVKKEPVEKLKPSENKTVVVNKKSLKFTPAKLVIKVGETVTWINNDGQKHNFVSVTREGESFSEPELFHLAPPGDVWSYTFYDPGEYPYYCFIHSRMKGEIIVVEE